MKPYNNYLPVFNNEFFIAAGTGDLNKITQFLEHLDPLQQKDWHNEVYLKIFYSMYLYDVY